MWVGPRLSQTGPVSVFVRGIRVELAVPPSVGERGYEPVSLAGHCGYEAGMPVAILQLDTQAPDVAVYDVAFGNEVRAPHGVEDLLPRNDAAAPARQQIEEALLDAAQMHNGITGPHLAAEDVHFDLAQGDRGNDRSVRTGCPPGYDDRSGEELLRRERHSENVVYAKVECLELGLQVAATGQAEHGSDAARQRVGRSELTQQRRAVVVVQIKRDEDLKTIPTLILTTSDAEADILQSYRLQANAYLTKPGQLEAFESLVRGIRNFWVLEAKLPPRGDTR